MDKAPKSTAALNLVSKQASGSKTPGFCYYEISSSTFFPRPGSFGAGVLLHLLVLLGPLWNGFVSPIPPRSAAHPKAPPKQSPQRVIRLVRFQPEARTRPPVPRKGERKKLTAPTKIEPLLPESGVSARFKGRIAISFTPDREQQLPKVLSHQNGWVGFGEGEVVRRQFEAPSWMPVSLPREGVVLSSFYYLLIDESSGLYDFVEELRRRETALASLKPYALFGFDFQAWIEESVRTAAAGKCAKGDDLRAVVRLDPSTDIRIEDVQCLKR